MSREAWLSIGAIVALMLPVSLFWATYEQQGNTIALWAEQLYRPPCVRRRKFRSPGSRRSIRS